VSLYSYVNLYVLSEYNVVYLCAFWKVKLAYFFLSLFYHHSIHDTSIYSLLVGRCVFVLSVIMDKFVFSILT